jgi:hypothetical protein
VHGCRTWVAGCSYAVCLQSHGTGIPPTQHISAVLLLPQVLSDAVPVDPDQIEALVGAAAGNAHMGTATAGSHSCDEPAAVLSAAA